MEQHIKDNPILVFLQNALRQESAPKEIISQIDWRVLLDFSVKQAILGVVYEGMKISRRQYPDIVGKGLFLSWGVVIDRQHRRFNVYRKKVQELSDMLKCAGFRTCILKGQGLSLMYPVPESRVSGDIDIWVEGSRKSITQYVHSITPHTFAQYHHIDFPYFKEVMVEVHYLPSQMSSPIYNARLQRFYKNNQPEQFSHFCPELGEGVCIPTKSFNAIFLLSHMMRHFFNEGIGLRQLIDYYYLMKMGFSKEEKNDFCKTVHYLGMEKFACAVMWIEQHVLGIEEDYLLIAPNEKAGVFLYEEISKSGNMGYYDQRYTFRKNGAWSRAMTDVYRDFALAKMFPSEALWKPLAKLVNQKWKVRNLLGMS